MITYEKLYEIVKKAIEEVGFDNFKKTSLFGSNQSKIPEYEWEDDDDCGSDGSCGD